MEKEKRKSLRIYIMGPPGSGKTSFAKKICQELKIKNFDLDDVKFRKDSYKKVNSKKRNEILKKILKNKQWVIEGSYAHPWINPAIKRANIVIILKKQFIFTIKRILMRYLKRKIKKNKAQKEAGTIKDVLKLVNYEYTYSNNYFLKHLELAKKFKKKILIFTRKSQLNKFIKELKCQYPE